MTRPRFFLALAVIAAGGFGGCNVGDGTSRHPRIVVVPGTLEFERPYVGSDIQEVLIQNSGTDELIIISASIGAPMFEIVSGFEGRLTIPRNESASIVVSYTPSADWNDAGTLVLRHNDPAAEGETRVPLVVPGSAPHLFVTPNPINFGRVPALGHRELTVNLTNIGGAELTVTNYLIVGGNGMFAFADGEAFTQAFTLGPDQARPIKINYDPVDDALHRAQLVVESNDPNTENGRTLVDIVGNGAEACIRIQPSEDSQISPGDEGAFDLGERSLGETAEETFTVLNCSDADAGQPLEVSSIVLGEDSSSTFGLDALPTFPRVLQPQESFEFQVTFTPEVEDQVETATLVATSNDPYEPELEISLAGTGVAEGE